MIATFSPRVTRRATRLAGWPTSGLALLQVAEEFAAGVEHQHVTLVVEAVAHGLQAAVERVKLGILRVGLGIDPRRTGVARTSGFLGLAVGFRQQHTTLTIGIGTNTLGQLATLGTVFPRLTLTLGTHALEHA